jgi:hypothetical protein
MELVINVNKDNIFKLLIKNVFHVLVIVLYVISKNVYGVKIIIF